MSLATALRKTIVEHIDQADPIALANVICALSPGPTLDFVFSSEPRRRFTPVEDGAVFDARTGLTFSKTLLDGKNVTQAEAAKACEALGPGWRLATVEELRELVDYTKHEPAIDTAAFPDTKSDYYWTSSPFVAYPDFAWIVCFGYGSVYYSPRRDRNIACVRAVRASQ